VDPEGQFVNGCQRFDDRFAQNDLAWMRVWI
jgi:hypothetical protein